MSDTLREIINVPVLAETSLASILTAMLVATVCAFVIYFVYRLFYRGIVYSENFNLLLVLVCLVTAFVIKTISVNLVLSLGMVGALSIVRFRAAVKDPLDVGFLFWAVAAGLTSGAQLYGTALICTFFIALIYIGMSFIRKEKKCFLLIVRYGPLAEPAVSEALNTLKYRLKNKTQTPEATEITVELKIRPGSENITETFRQIPEVYTCTLLEYSGDYAN